MAKRFRNKLNYSNVIATTALFLALGGAAVAAGLPRRSVGTRQLKSGAVTTFALHRGAVTHRKLGPASVRASNLSGNSVGADALQNGAVTAAKLAKGEFVTPNLLASGQSERGTFMLGGNTTVDRGAISYPIPLTSAAEAKVLEIGTSTPQCPGRPIKDPRQITVEAEPGYLCIYIALTQGKNPSLHIKYGETNLGAGLEATFDEANPENTIFGFWTVTQGP